MTALQKTTRPELILSVFALQPKDRANIRGIILMDTTRLSALRGVLFKDASSLNVHWHISETHDGADAIINPPRLGETSGSIVLNRADGTKLVFELKWPLQSKDVIYLLNSIGQYYREYRGLKSKKSILSRTWLANMFSGMSQRPKTTPSTAPVFVERDNRNTVNKYLTLFGKQPKKKTINILIAGSPGSGKTALISAVTMSPALLTEATATDTVAAIKPRTTIALEYGHYETEQSIFRLYGTPGQLRLAHIMKQTLTTCDACLLLADASSDSPADDICNYIQLLNDFGMHKRPMLIGTTHLDTSHMPYNISDKVEKRTGIRIPNTPLDPRDHISVALSLNLLTLKLL